MNKNQPGERFAYIPLRVASSEAYLSLTASAYRLLTLALCKYNGHNNGDISLPRSELKKFGFTSADTLNRAIKLLRRNGLLSLTRQGGFANGGKLANLYGFSWLGIPENNRLDISTPAKASDDWKLYSSHRSELTSTCTRGSLTPIRASSRNTRTAPTERTNFDRPDTS